MGGDIVTAQQQRLVREPMRDLLEHAVLAKHALDELLTPIADGTVDADDALSLSEQLVHLADGFKAVAKGGQPSSLGTFAVETSYRIAGVNRELRSRLEGLLPRREQDMDYLVTVVVEAEQLDAFGAVADLAALRPFASYLKETFDHRLINEVLKPDPTNERFAQHLGCWFIDNVEPHQPARLRSVRVTEPNGATAVWERTAP